jgi:hypothetical protein
MVFDTQFLLFLLGICFLAAGAAGITGKWKRWYWNSRRMAFAYLPFGILFLLAAVEQTITDSTISTVMRVVEFLVLGVAVWWIIRPPQFVMPAWIKLIESHPKTTYDAMAAAVKAKEEWRSKVETAAALEKWMQTIERRSPKRKSGGSS